jgi:hypothetical protein
VHLGSQVASPRGSTVVLSPAALLGIATFLRYGCAVAARKRAAVVRAATGDEVIIGEAELRHAMSHFTLPRDIVLALIIRVLEHPTLVLADDSRAPREYRLFYRLEDGRYLLAVVKVTAEAAFFASLYPTGRSIRPSHRRFRRVLP